MFCRNENVFQTRSREAACCGIDCGARGTPVGDTEACECHCADGYVGDRCQLAPLPAGMAEAYTIAGAADSKYNGRYERLAGAECNGKPVYQLGGEGGNMYVLFQPTDTSFWAVSIRGYRHTSPRSGADRGSENRNSSIVALPFRAGS